MRPTPILTAFRTISTTSRSRRMSSFCSGFRALLGEYEGRTTVGEVGDGRRSLKTVAAYTNGGDKLHMCYTFDMLGVSFPPNTSAAASPISSRSCRMAGFAGPSPTMMSSGTFHAGCGRATMRSIWPGLPSPCCLHSADRSASTRARNWGWKKPISRSRI
jgi:hypothetical protein